MATAPGRSVQQVGAAGADAGGAAEMKNRTGDVENPNSHSKLVVYKSRVAYVRKICREDEYLLPHLRHPHREHFEHCRRIILDIKEWWPIRRFGTNG
ncbi:unnamed protein product [Amoebophrya sp. A120]|nr:unnamed protein product [Amoebophrya sp. A120]|eukprot:GSA120T00010320001.1